MGHEFKIDLEDDVPPVHWPPLLKTESRSSWTEAKKQIEMLLEHQFIRPSEFPIWCTHPIYSKRRMEAFGFVWITIG